MAGFNIEYIISAVDRVSEILNRVNQNINNNVSRVRSSLQRTSNHLNRFFNSNLSDLIDGLTSRSRVADRVIGTLYNRLYDTDNIFRRINVSSREFYNRMNMGAFNAFINSMSVVMPLMMAFKKPYQDVVNLQREQLNLSYDVSNKQADYLKKQAEKYSQILNFSNVDITSAQSKLSSLVPNKDDLKNMINSGDFSKIIETTGLIAEKTGQKIQDTLNDTTKAIMSNTKANIDGVIVTGAGQHQRILSLINGFSKKYPSFAEKFQKLSQFKINKSFDKLNDSLEKLLIVGLPILTKFIQIVTNIISSIINWTSIHQELTKILVIATAVILTFIAGQIAFYAIMTGVAAVVAGVTGEIGLMNASLLANPIGIVIALIVSVVTVMYEMYQHIKLIHTAMNAFSNFVITGVVGAFKILISILKYVIDVIIWLKNTFENVIGMLVRGVTYLVKAFNWIHPTVGGTALINQLNGVADSLERVHKVQNKIKPIGLNKSTIQSNKNKNADDLKIKMYSEYPANNNSNKNTNVNTHIYIDGQKKATYQATGDNTTFNVGSNNMMHGSI